MDLLKNLFKGDKVIWVIFVLLCVISITEVFSASSTLIYRSGNHWEPITRHLIFLIAGAGVVVLFHNIPYKWFQVFPLFLLPLSIGLLAFVMLMGFVTGDRVNGAARWMTFMGFQFQPSEIAKMAIGTLLLSESASPVPQVLLDRHYRRKHGPDAYFTHDDYGNGEVSTK